MKAELAAEGSSRSPRPRRSCASSRSRCPNPADASRARRRRRRLRRAPDDRRRDPPRPRSTTPRSRRRSDSSTPTRGAEASGSRFAYVMREAVLLELALVQWVMNARSSSRASRRSYRRCSCASARWKRPASSRPTARRCTRSTVASSSSPARARCRSRCCGAATLLDPDELPARYAGFSSNFRREAGTYGKDTRGIFRVHQFDKIEMFSYCEPDESWEEHDRLLAIEESILTDLGLPYRVINVAAGDLGPAAAKKYDIEVWLPSEGRYRESHSCSNYLEFSARRLEHACAGRRRQPARAHAQRHRVRDRPHARVPVRALPGPRRRLRGPRRAAPLRRLRTRRTPQIARRVATPTLIGAR